MTKTFTELLNHSSYTVQDRYLATKERLDDILKINPIEKRWDHLEKLGQELATLMIENLAFPEKAVLIPDFLVVGSQTKLLCYETANALNLITAKDEKGDEKKRQREKNKDLIEIFSKSPNGNEVVSELFFSYVNQKHKKERLECLKYSFLPALEQKSMAQKKAYEDSSFLTEIKMLRDKYDDFRSNNRDTRLEVERLISLLNKEEIEGFASYIFSFIQFRGERQREYLLSEEYRRRNEGRKVKIEELEHRIIEKMLMVSSSFASSERLIQFAKTLKESGVYQEESWDKVEETLKDAIEKVSVESDEYNAWQNICVFLTQEKLKTSLKSSEKSASTRKAKI